MPGGSQDDARYRYAVVRIRTFHAENPLWQEPVVVTVRDEGGKYEVVGLQRPARPEGQKQGNQPKSEWFDRA